MERDGASDASRTDHDEEDGIAAEKDPFFFLFLHSASILQVYILMSGVLVGKCAL